MKKQYAVIGLGRFGYSVAKTLTELGEDVIAIDNNEERVRKIADFVTESVVMDALDEKALRSIGLQNVDVAVVSIGENIEASILVVMILKEMGVQNIIAKAVTSLHGKVLENLNVTRIVYPERDMAVRVAQQLARPTILEHLELSPEYSIIEIPAPSFVAGRMLRDTGLRNKYGINLIAIRRRKSETGLTEWNVNPAPTDIIQPEDILVVIGSNTDLERLNNA
ncbi:MAG: TrkA family potassium uptake protein [Dissulfuribacterales bacterium]